MEVQEGPENNLDQLRRKLALVRDAPTTRPQERLSERGDISCLELQFNYFPVKGWFTILCPQTLTEICDMELHK